MCSKETERESGDYCVFSSDINSVNTSARCVSNGYFCVSNNCVLSEGNFSVSFSFSSMTFTCSGKLGKDVSFVQMLWATVS